MMNQTKDRVTSQPTDTDIINVLAAIKRDINPTHAEPALFFDSNAQFVAAGSTPSPRTIEAFVQLWADQIHAAGMLVTHRHTFAGIKNNYNFTKLQGGNRFPMGSVATVLPNIDFTDDYSSGSLANYTALGGWTIQSGELVSGTPSTWSNMCLKNGTYTDFVATGKLKAIANTTQLAFRTSTSAGYGAQIRFDDQKFRLERWGISNLGEVDKTITIGSWYWVKVSAIGTAIKAKMWADGTTEPASWDIEVTNATHASGQIGFSSESANAHYDDFTIDLGSNYNSFLGLIYQWITNNPTQIHDGDNFNLITEPTECSADACIFVDAQSWVPYPNPGDQYGTWVGDLKIILANRMAALGKTMGPSFPPGDNWSEVASGFLPTSMYTNYGSVSHDHYGAASATPVQDVSTEGSPAGSETYAVPTSLSEATTDKQTFSVGNTGYQVYLDVYIQNKGTGDWTVTWHNSSNEAVQQLNEKVQSLPALSSYNTVTIPNGALVSGAYNRFYLSWDKPSFGGSYHCHVTSTVNDGTILVVTGQANNLERSYMVSYRSEANARSMEIDMRRTYAAKGVPLNHLEWSDFWNGPVTGLGLNQGYRVWYQNEFYRVFSRLADEGIYVGFQYWRASSGNSEAILAQNADGTYYANALGKTLASHFHGNGLIRYPILTAGDTTGTF